MKHKLTTEEQLAAIRGVQAYLAAIRLVASCQTGLERLRLLTEPERLKRHVIAPLNRISRLRPPGSRVGEALHRLTDLVGASSSDIRRIIDSSQFAQAINLLADCTSCRPDTEDVNTVLVQITEM